MPGRRPAGANSARLGARSIIPLVTDEDRALVRRTDRQRHAGPGRLPRRRPRPIRQELHRRARRGRRRPAEDAAVAAADTLLVTVPNQLGVEYNTRLLAAIAEHVAPAIGWEPAG